MIELSGPSVTSVKLRIAESLDRISFRFILHYSVRTDDNELRLDVKSGDQQHGTSLSIEQRSETGPIRRDTPLYEPKGGIIKAMAVMVDRDELIGALRDLADALEQTRND